MVAHNSRIIPPISAPFLCSSTIIGQIKMHKIVILLQGECDNIESVVAEFGAGEVQDLQEGLRGGLEQGTDSVGLEFVPVRFVVGGDVQRD